METRDIIELILAVLAGLGVFGAGLGYAAGKFREGQNNRRKDDTEVKKDAFSFIQEQLDSLEELCQKQQKEITILQTQVDERDKKAKEYIEIFQNRNPEMLAFMQYLTETAKTSNAYMKDTSMLFTTLKPILERLATHLEKE